MCQNGEPRPEATAFFFCERPLRSSTARSVTDAAKETVLFEESAREKDCTGDLRVPDRWRRWPERKGTKMEGNKMGPSPQRDTVRSWEKGTEVAGTQLPPAFFGD